MLSIFFIGLALSMDAFSLSLSLGTTNIKAKQKFILTGLIAVMHFIMPQLGSLIGNYLFQIVLINVNIFNIIIFLYLGMTMFFKRAEKCKLLTFSYFSMVIMAICVSIDSLGIGLGLNAITNYPIIASLIFALCSGVISYFGMILGEQVIELLEEKANYFGASILFLLAIIHIVKEIF